MTKPTDPHRSSGPETDPGEDPSDGVGASRSPPPRRPAPPIFNAPPATVWLLAVLAAVFAAVQILPSAWAEILVLRLALIPGLFLSAFEHLDRPLAWLALITPLTHAVVHQDFLHLLVNGGLFLAFGSAIERRFGRPRFLILCAVTALAGAATQMAADWGAFVPMIGASGTVSGLMGGVVRTLASDRIRPDSRRLAIALMAVLLIGNGVIGAFGGTIFGLPGAIAWQAHLGGLAAGFLLTDLWLRRDRGRGVPQR